MNGKSGSRWDTNSASSADSDDDVLAAKTPTDTARLFAYNCFAPDAVILLFVQNVNSSRGHDQGM